MKLISLHISGFGKLSNFDYSFNSKISIINEQNGWGKTTFANFIKAMFYSMPVTKTKDLDKNPRKKYKPWNANVFGGNLTFEHDGNQYRIERTFSSNEQDDTFSLFNAKTNKPSNDYTSNIGIELFGINSDSFSKTTYLPQSELETELTDNISAKLGNLAHDKSDLSAFNNALLKIDETRKLYIKTGERGLLYEKQRELEHIENQKQLLTNISSAIDSTNNKINAISTQIKNLEKEENQLNKEINVSATQEKFEIENKQFIDLQEKIKNAEKELSEINLIIKNTPPAEDEFAQMKQYNQDINDLLLKIKNLESTTNDLQKQYESLKIFFNNKIPNSNQIENFKNDFKTITDHQNINQKNTILIENNKNYKSIYILICLLSFIGLTTLSILFACSIINIIALIVPMVLIITIIIITILIMRKIANTQYKFNNINNLLKLQENLSNKLDYNFEQSVDLSTKLYIVEKNYKEIENITSDLKLINDELLNFKNVYVKKSSYLTNILQFYFTNVQIKDNYINYIFKLSELTNKYKYLVEFIKSNKKSLETITYHEILENTLINSSDILIERKQNVVNQLNTLRKELNNQYSQLQAYELQLEELEDLDLKLEKLTNEISEIKHKTKILKETANMLSAAKDDLDSLFVEPITKAVSEISTILNAKDIESFRLDTSLNLTIDNNGQSKELSYLSKGYQDIAHIAIRFACLPMLFKNIQPFIILDDPFVNLDEEKLAFAKKLINKLSNDYQIIYLVCHNSRI